MSRSHVHIDFETYSECPLKTHGAYVYSKDPSTELLCMAYAHDDEDPVLWLPGESLPDFVLTSQEYELVAWNSMFEYLIWHHTCGWPVAPIPTWTDAMAMAAKMALPLGLGACAAALHLPQDKQKDKRGKQLIQRLCQPYRGKRVRDKKLLEELYDYCIQDVIAERAVTKKLAPL